MGKDPPLQHDTVAVGSLCRSIRSRAQTSQWARPLTGLESSHCISRDSRIRVLDSSIAEEVSYFRLSCLEYIVINFASVKLVLTMILKLLIF